MELPILEEVSKLQSKQNVLGVLVSDNLGLCICSSGNYQSKDSGQITVIANYASKLDKDELYPIIILKSDNKSCLIKGNESSCVSVLFDKKTVI